MPDAELPESAPAMGVRRYDFKTARKLTQNQRIKLGNLHSRLAVGLGRKMEESLKVAPTVTYLGLEQVQGAAFEAADYGEVITAEIPIRPGVGKIFLVWPRTLAFFVIEKVLGGSGDKLYTAKELSEFEQGILRKYSDTVFRVLQGFFEKTRPEGGCELIREGLGAFAEELPYEVLLIGRLNLKLNQQEGKLTLIYPYSVIKPWLDETGSNPEALAPAAPAQPKSLVPKGLATAPVNVMVKIEPTVIKLSDFTNLQVGDCLRLNHATQEPFSVYVDSQLKFQGHLGVIGGQLALKIASKVKPEP